MSISRRQFNQLVLLATAAGTLPSASFAATTTGTARPVSGGTLKLLYRVDQANALFAINTSSGTGQAIGPKIVEGLLTFDFDLNPEALLATEWSVSDDYLRYTFKLRPNVKWHDGKDFTSEDVAFSIFRFEGGPSARPHHLSECHRRRETPDPLTAIIVLSKPAPFLITAQSSSESHRAQAYLREAQAGRRANPGNRDRHGPVQADGMGGRQPSPSRQKSRLLGCRQALSGPHYPAHRLPILRRGRRHWKRAKWILAKALCRLPSWNGLSRSPTSWSTPRLMPIPAAAATAILQLRQRNLEKEGCSAGDCPGDQGGGHRQHRALWLCAGLAQPRVDGLAENV